MLNEWGDFFTFLRSYHPLSLIDLTKTIHNKYISIDNISSCQNKIAFNIYFCEN